MPPIRGKVFLCTFAAGWSAEVAQFCVSVIPEAIDKRYPARQSLCPPPPSRAIPLLQPTLLKLNQVLPCSGHVSSSSSSISFPLPPSDCYHPSDHFAIISFVVFFITLCCCWVYIYWQDALCMASASVPPNTELTVHVCVSGLLLWDVNFISHQAAGCVID